MSDLRSRIANTKIDISLLNTLQERNHSTNSMNFISSGAGGVIYSINDNKVIKIIPPDTCSNYKDEYETSIYMSLHDIGPKIYDTFSYDNNNVIVLQKLDKSLDDILQVTQNINQQQIASLLALFKRSLNIGFNHSDMGPPNIMFDNNDKAYFIDANMRKTSGSYRENMMNYLFFCSILLKQNIDLFHSVFDFVMSNVFIPNNGEDDLPWKLFVNSTSKTNVNVYNILKNRYPILSEKS